MQVLLVLAPTVVEYWLARQLIHADVAPTFTEYVPAAQTVQGADPVVVLNVPAMQGVHGPPFAPEYPALHRQLLAEVAPAGAFELLEHCKQVVMPDTLAYVPAMHVVQRPVPCNDLNFPRGHKKHSYPLLSLPGGHAQPLASPDALVPSAVHSKHVTACVCVGFITNNPTRPHG